MEQHLSPAGAECWSCKDFLPSGGDLPDWLAALAERHRAALTEYEASFGAGVSGRESIERDARAWRRAVRNSVAQGAEPPQRTFNADVVAAQIQVGEEDTAVARDDLALMSVYVLNE